MKTRLSILTALFLTAAASAAIAAGMAAPVILTPDSMHWIAATGRAKGTWRTVLAGDPGKSGTSVIRVKMPDGYINQPHYHAHPEYITVIQGSLLFGTGDSIDKSKAKTIPAGSFILVPAGVRHWSMAKGATIEEVGGEGPLNNLPIKRGTM